MNLTQTSMFDLSGRMHSSGDSSIIDAHIDLFLEKVLGLIKRLFPSHGSKKDFPSIEEANKSD